MRSTLLSLVVLSTLALAATGGPDGGGYYWHDQAEDPNFFNDNWVDIYYTGTNLGLSSSGTAFAGTIAWDFKYYGNVYHDIFVSADGTIFFNDWFIGPDNVAIPGPNTYSVETFLAPFWTDLNPVGGSGSNVFFEDFGDHFVVQWNDVIHDSGYGTMFIAIGWESVGGDNSEIAFLYNFRITEPNATIGIQGDNSTGTGNEYNPSSVDTYDWYLYTPTGIYNWPVKESSWGQIKATF